MRKFELRKATREQVPLLIAMFGVSGGGKTYSALRLATGIQRVSPGPIAVIDTEARRALHYSSAFDFQHMEFGAPFSPLDYLSAIEHCVKEGAKTIVVDSLSHEHEGPGGVLEMSERYLDEKAGNDWRKRDRLKFSSWIIPKQQRTRLMNSMLQMPVNFILCFRAKEKLKILKNEQGKNEPTPVGLMPIGELGFVFEMTTSILLPPGANGVPDWNPPEPGSRMMVKLPSQFRGILDDGKPLSESHGEALAKWAAGDSAAQPRGKSTHETLAESEAALETMLADYRLCTTDDELAPLEDKRREIWSGLNKSQKAALKKASDDAQERVNDRRGDAYEDPTGT